MKIAFDVKGTLQGPEGGRLLGLLLLFLDKGHEVTVWSNSYFFAQDFVKNNNLEGRVEYGTKYSKRDAEECQRPVFDLAFEDDHMQDYLAANKFVFVDELEDHHEKLLADLYAKT